MPGMFSSGGGKMKYPNISDIIETRTPQAVGMESELRDYFRGLLQSPNMGFQSRKTYDPTQMYLDSIQGRGGLTSAVTTTPRTESERSSWGNAFGDVIRGGFQGQTPTQMPSWGSTIAQSVASRPGMPTNMEEWKKMMGPDWEEGDKWFQRSLPFLRLSGQVPTANSYQGGNPATTQPPPRT